MKTVFCTLFEGAYHHGVAALANSLANAGFRGDLVIGHRGSPPDWAVESTNADPAWPKGTRVLAKRDAPRLVFVPLVIDAHFGNYKPTFMRSLLDGPASDADGVFYADPDICVTRPWRDFEQWIKFGIALCEDCESPLPKHHPRREAWRQYYAERGLPLRFVAPEYVNSGFVGVRREDMRFLDLWIRAVELMAEEIGSLSSTKLSGGAGFRSKGPVNCFDNSDQDALNIAIEASDVVPSIIGAEAMAFKHGPAWVPHAVNTPKPWNRPYIRLALGGVAPRLADKCYWANANGPYITHSPWERLSGRISIGIGAAIGRFIRRT